MQIDLIYQYYFENKTEFIRNTLTSEWDILIAVVDGEYAISFKDEQKNIVLGKNDIMFIPGGVEFDREVLSPITYYHLSFYPQADHPFYLSAVLSGVSAMMWTRCWNRNPAAAVLIQRSFRRTAIIVLIAVFGCIVFKNSENKKIVS